MAKIFVSVANYRDTETLNTVREMIATCSAENELRVVVLSQLAPEDLPAFSPLSDLRQVQHVITPARDSMGVCWARAQIQSYLADEDYYLQIDSHMACWEPGWDKILIEDLRRAEELWPKVILTAYPSSYEIAADGSRVVDQREPTRFNLSMEHGVCTATSGYAPVVETPEEEFFVSANLLFSRSQLARDVPYDSELFFVGEEITLAIRAYTRGYRIFSPTRYVVAHRYSRSEGERPVFWQETEDHSRQVRWWQRDLTSKIKCAHVCRGEWFGTYGIADSALYEQFAFRVRRRYAGLDIRKTVAHTDLRVEVSTPRIRPASLDFSREPSSGWVLSG